MRLLFLANRIPYPPHRGDKLKIYHLAKRLAKRHELHLLTFTEREEEKQHESVLREIFKEVQLIHLPKWKAIINTAASAAQDLPLQVAYFQSPAMRQMLSALLASHHYDAVHIQHLRMAPYMAEHKSIPRILDLPDAFSLYWKRRKEIQRSLIKRAFEEVESDRVARYEGRILTAYDKVLACSPEDIAYLREKHGATNLSLLPNGVDLDAFDRQGSHDYSQSGTLLFTGNMDYAPNVDAVIYFTREILPRIRQSHPGVRFIIAGQRPVPRVLDLQDEGAEVTGFVEDMAAMYRQASVVVAPLRFGAGTQNKVLEGMAAGVPVVCSEIGFAGLGVQSGEGVVLQREPEGFAQAVGELLSSENTRKTVGEKGAAAVRARYGWDAIAAKLEGYFEEVVASRSGTRSAGGTILGESIAGAAGT